MFYLCFHLCLHLCFTCVFIIVYLCFHLILVVFPSVFYLCFHLYNTCVERVMTSGSNSPPQLYYIILHHTWEKRREGNFLNLGKFWGEIYNYYMTYISILDYIELFLFSRITKQNNLIFLSILDFILFMLHCFGDNFSFPYLGESTFLHLGVISQKTCVLSQYVELFIYAILGKFFLQKCQDFSQAFTTLQYTTIHWNIFWMNEYHMSHCINKDCCLVS